MGSIQGSRCATFHSGTRAPRKRPLPARPSRWMMAFIAAWLLAVGVERGNAATITKASTSRADREAAEREMPLASLTPEARQRIQRVLDKPSLYRRMPVSVVECDQQLYRFLVRHPEVVVNIWQLMGITKVTATRVGPYQLDAQDGAGTVTNIELVYGNQDTHLFYCEGKYDGPLFSRPLTGRCVLLLKSGYQEHPDRTCSVSSRMDVFLQIDNLAVDAVTRTLHPLLGKSADLNFIESTKFVERISQTSAENGPGMVRLAGRLDKVDEDVRQEFATITSQVFAKARGEDAAAARTAQLDTPLNAPANQRR